MRLGATLVHLTGAPPFGVTGWARRLAGAGYESLWTPQLIGRGDLVPDPFITLAAAAAATESVTDSGTDPVALGTATVQVPLHHPVELAHRIRSLHLVCGDRLTVGLSPGSTAADFAALDRDYPARFGTFTTTLTRLRRLLADGRDERAVLAPDGLGAGRPPLLLGSWGAQVERAAREFDGWLASGYRRSPDQIIGALHRFRAAGGGRAVVCTVPAGPDLGRTAEVLHRYADAGFDDAVLLFDPAGPSPEQVRACYP